MCRARGRVVLATVVDHIEPHRGDQAKFYGGALQSLCKQCHDSDKQRIELGKAPKPEIGLDGWPK